MMRSKYILRGADGSRWDLTGPSHTPQDAWILHGLSGVWQTPPKELIRTSRARQHGSTPRMTRVDERIVDFRARLEATTRSGFEQLFAAWNRAWSTDVGSVLEVHTEGYGKRDLHVRLDRHMQPDVAKHSLQSTKIEIECVIVACWPYLTSGIDAKDYVAVGGRVEFPIINRTDVPLWLEYGGTPAIWSLPDGLSDRMVKLPAQSDIWKVRTRQNFETLSGVQPGVNEWARMRGVSFMYEIPPGTKKTMLTATVEAAQGTPTLRVFQPRYHQMPVG